MKVSIIIPNYNGKHFLKPCLASLRRQSFQDFRLVVVDNGSSDGSAAFVSAFWPEALVIRLASNRGFAAAVNAGIQKSCSRYVMVLNNDTVLHPQCLSRLVDTLEQNPRAFSTGPRILSLAPPHRTDTSGDFYSLPGYAFCRDQGLPAFPRRSGEVFTNSACAVLYRRSLLEKTGLFDEQFFAYLEDVDLGIRARRLGFPNLHCSRALVWHTGSGTTGKQYTALKVFCSARNNMLLLKKNFSPLQLLLHLPFLAGGCLLKYCYFRRFRLHQVYRKGCLAGLRKAASCRSHPGLHSLLRTGPWILYGTVLFVRQYLKRRLLKP